MVLIYGKNTHLISGKSSDLRTHQRPWTGKSSDLRRHYVSYRATVNRLSACFTWFGWGGVLNRNSSREQSICVFYMATWFGWGGISITTANHTTTTHNLKLKQTLVTYLMYPVLHLDITYCEKFRLQVRPCIYIANFTRFRSNLLNIELSSKSDTVSHFGL